MEYLQSKLDEIDEHIVNLEHKHQLEADEIKDLYFQKGKLYSDLELMKRVPHYD